MNKKKNLLHENKWFKTPKQIMGPKFEAGDQIRMLGLIHLKSKDTSQTRKAVITFYVTTNNKKSTTQQFVMQYDETGYSNKVETDIFVEYDEKDEATLIEESETLTKTMAAMAFEKGGIGDFEVDMQQPIIIAKPPKGTTNENIIFTLAQNEQTYKQAQMLDEIFKLNVLKQAQNAMEKIKELMSHAGLQGGFNEAMPQIPAQQVESLYSPKEPIGFHSKTVKETDRIKKAATEASLMATYGKKKIKKLAKQIGYKGVLINKKDKKTKTKCK